jgi:hypothetical protein
MSDYTKRQIKAGNRRLLRLAAYLREHARRQDFEMHVQVNECGTPACAFGHYASMPRTPFKIGTSSRNQFMHVMHRGSQRSAFFGDKESCDHFGVSYAEVRELFDFCGCGCADTPKQAARYIERFVQRRGGA